MNMLNVSEIQHFSTGDGPGIRTTVFLKGCNLHCPWCHNPETVSALPERLVYAQAGKVIVHGRFLPIEKIAEEVLEDKEFYGDDGGLTLSGGEPMLQSEEFSGLIDLLAEERVNTVIDTAACVPWERFVPLLGRIQVFLIDYKTADSEKYAKIVGGDREAVLNNISKLTGRGENVRVRVPLIPGFNLSENDAEMMCGQLLGAGVKSVDLLPFHRLGSAKYAAMGKEYAYASTSPPGPDEILRIKNIYGQYFDCIVE